MGKKVKIAIIDTGFDFQSKLFSKIIEYKNFSGGVWMDECGHGTSIVRIIDSICENCELYILKALNANSMGDFCSVQAAISYAIDLKVDIINASFGIETAIYEQEINSLCSEAYYEGIILATTRANNRSRNYLYENEKVLKVVRGKCIQKNRLYYKDSVFFVLGMARMIPWLGGHYVLKGGNSFSLPMIIPYVIQAKQDGCMGLDDVTDFLERLAKKTEDTAIFYDYPIVEKDNVKDIHIYKIVSNYIEKKGLLNPCGSIAHTVFELYKTEEILHGLEDMLSCILPCLEFQYPDWCYVENLSNKISRLVQRKSLQKLYSERRKNDGCQHMDNR